MKCKKRLLSLVLAFAMCFTLCGSAFAVSVNPAVTYRNETLYFEVGINTASSITEQEYLLSHASAFSNIDTTTQTIAVNVSIAETTEKTLRMVDLSSVNGLSFQQQLALGYQLLPKVGYSEKQVENLEPDMIFSLLDGEELTTAVSYIADTPNGPAYYSESQASDPSSGESLYTSSVVRSVLSYVRYSNGQYLVVLVAYVISPPVEPFMSHYGSICIQNFAIIADTANASLSYTTPNGEKQKVSYDTSSQYAYHVVAQPAGGSGFSFDLPIPTSSTNHVYTDIQATIACYAYNSSVVPGGAFNIYGTISFTTLKDVLPSFSFPLGVSVSPEYQCNSYTNVLTGYLP